MYISNKISKAIEEALCESRSLNKKKITKLEFFKIWDKHLSGDIDMIKFEEYVREIEINIIM